MKRTQIFSVSLLVVASFAASSASASDPFSLGKAPHAPVGEEVWRLDAQRAPSSTTRAQVNADLSQAQRLGQISVGGEPWRFVAPPMAASNTRLRVVAELREAQRLGLVNVGGEGNTPVASAEQERLITLAGQRGIGAPAMAKR